MQHIIIVGGLVALIIILSRRKKRKQRATTRTVTTRTVYARNIKQPDPYKLQRDAEKRYFQAQRDAEKRRIQYEREKQRTDRLNMIKTQAAADLEHLQQRRRDLLKAYDMIPDADTERNIRKRIQYDNAIRNTDKQIETAIYNMNRTY